MSRVDCNCRVMRSRFWPWHSRTALPERRCASIHRCGCVLMGSGIALNCRLKRPGAWHWILGHKSEIPSTLSGFDTDSITLDRARRWEKPRIRSDQSPRLGPTLVLTEKLSPKLGPRFQKTAQSCRRSHSAFSSEATFANHSIRNPWKCFQGFQIGCRAGI